MKVKAIITGSTGMVGEGVLLECLSNPNVEEILLINRRSYGIQHPKVKEIIHSDFGDYSSIEDRLKGYNAAFLCMGMTSVGATEESYTKVTYTYTLALAKKLVSINPEITICYVSGAGTKQDENAKNMWIRVKGKTEKDLLALPCKAAFMFRPGFMYPTKGAKNTLKLYKYTLWMFPLFKLIVPNFMCTLKEVGQAMINTVMVGYSNSIIEVKDIKQLASAK